MSGEMLWQLVKWTRRMVSKVSSYDGDDAAEGGGTEEGERTCLAESGGGGTEEEGERTCLAESGGVEAGGGAEEEGERTCLAEAIDSLLDVKPELNTAWAESVRQILLSTDLSSPIPSTSNGRSSRSSSCWHTTSSWRENHHQHHDKVVAGLEGELLVLKTALGVSNSHRRRILNRVLDLKGNIRVFCRVRPLLSNERNARVGHLITPGMDIVKIPSARKDFQFDKVFLPSSLQDDVFLEVEPIIRSALDGHNVCIFAYGQTGTGKTFTMEGNKDQPGVVPRTLQRLFDEAYVDTSVSYTFSLSMLEVYKGSLRDLLVCQQPARCTDPASKCLSIQMASDGYIDVDNLTEMPIMDAKEASKLYQRGSQSRSTSCTNANETSSRSHCLLRITITCTYVLESHKFATTSKLWLVDLGGSERLSKTNAQGLTLEEGKAINVSLSALGDVISALQRKQPHVPYRNSKLTQLLRDSLGEQSKTLMLVHVSPKEMDIKETVCSLSFASRARGTHIGHEISQEGKTQRAAAIAELYRLMSIYDDDCRSLRESIKTIESLIEERKASLFQTVQGSISDQLGSSNDPALAHELSTYLTPTSKTTCADTLVDALNMVPRFMGQTASSRHKQRSSSKEIIGLISSSPNERSVKNGGLKRARNSKSENLNSPDITSGVTESNVQSGMLLGDSEVFEQKPLSIVSVVTNEIGSEPVASEDLKSVDNLSQGENLQLQLNAAEETGSVTKGVVVVVDTQEKPRTPGNWSKRQRPERMEKSGSLSPTIGRTCRGRRKVIVQECRRKATVECSVTVMKPFVY